MQRFEHYELVTDEEGKPIELVEVRWAITYKAFDVDLRCPVALKVIRERYLNDESARLRFLREARVAARCGIQMLPRSSTWANWEQLLLRHGVCGGRDPGAPDHALGPAEAKLALEIVTQVAAGLAAVHKQKIVHRDIKPGNIMVGLEEGGAGR